MMNPETGTKKNLLDKLFGGLNMNWLTVVLFAVGAAVLTAVFLIVPVFKNTSFERMGVFLEAWIFFAVIIMANCKKPLESALKTFVFFLISQPLIYLIQVPFSPMGWSIFSYYPRWLIATLITFPLAFVGWYITKRNWLSVLILAPVLAFLGTVVYESGLRCVRQFPHLLVTALFCLLQIILYILAFFPDLPKKMVGLLVPIAAAAVLGLTAPKVDVNATDFLPDSPTLSESAEVVMDENPVAEVSIESTGKDSMVRIHAADFGTADFVIRDGKQEYAYTLEVFEDENGHSQLRITER